MAGQKDMEKTETVEVVKSGSSMELAGQNLTSGKDGIPSDSTVISSTKGEKKYNKSVEEHGLCYQPSSCYSNYYYPGYNGNFTQMDGYYQPDGSYTSLQGMQSDDGSLVYYLPGYNPYATVDGQQPYFSSSGYIQHPVSYGSEAVPFYSWDSKSSNLGIAKTSPGSNLSVKSNGANTTKANGNVSSKFSKPIPHTHPLKPLNKVPHQVSDFSSGFLKGVQPLGRYPSIYDQKQGSLPNYSSLNYRQNGRIWTGNDRFRQRVRPFKTLQSSEITRGPRGNNGIAHSDSAIVKDSDLTVSRDQYNLAEFETEYENAKFYVIKSFSEDNVHKCVKYGVWSSTANGNRKLDAAFHEASEKGTKCPVFLFFSVNGSGQFVGCAEMIGKVDFDKDMDFWQLDKWNGFFPVKWHIVKDVPNAQLRHIILENNDNKDVTYTRDTQEIGMKQGLEMLKIFKSYTAKTSILDDFNFYEVREKSGCAKRSSSKPTSQQNEINKDAEEASDPLSLINLTKNLSLSASETDNAVKILMESSVPSVPFPAA